MWAILLPAPVPLHTRVRAKNLLSSAVSLGDVFSSLKSQFALHLSEVLPDTAIYPPPQLINPLLLSVFSKNSHPV